MAKSYYSAEPDSRTHEKCIFPLVVYVSCCYCCNLYGRSYKLRRKKNNCNPLVDILCIFQPLYSIKKIFSDKMMTG